MTNSLVATRTLDEAISVYQLFSPTGVMNSLVANFTLDEAIQCTNCSHQPAHGVHWLYMGVWDVFPRLAPFSITITYIVKSTWWKVHVGSCDIGREKKHQWRIHWWLRVPWFLNLLFQNAFVYVVVEFLFTHNLQNAFSKVIFRNELLYILLAQVEVLAQVEPQSQCMPAINKVCLGILR